MIYKIKSFEKSKTKPNYVIAPSQNHTCVLLFNQSRKLIGYYYYLSSAISYIKTIAKSFKNSIIFIEDYDEIAYHVKDINI